MNPPEFNIAKFNIPVSMTKRLFIGVLILILALALNSVSCSSSTNAAPQVQSNIAAVESVGVSLVTGGLDAVLKPINAKANTNYEVDLYENGNLRQSENITWNQPQINVGTTQMIFFSLSEDEYNAYLTASEKNSNWWKSIFSIKIQEISTVALTYPKGGEIWHVGDAVTITWTSTNLPEDTQVIIWIAIPNETNEATQIAQVPNTGSYQWTVPNSVSGYSIIGTQERVSIRFNGDSQSYISTSYNGYISDDFTIESSSNPIPNQPYAPTNGTGG
jgi:hypothetical protein